MAVSGVRYILGHWGRGLATIGAVLACRLAMRFIKRGGLQWRFESADEFNAWAEMVGDERRIRAWENAKMITEYDELREVIAYVAALPVLPFEKEGEDT